MAMSDSCAACGCHITNNKTADGPAVLHGAKLYCSECAAMILPPEELERLSKPAQPADAKSRSVKAAPPRPVARVMVEDEVLGEEEVIPAEKTKTAPMAPTAASGLGVQRSVAAAPKREAAASGTKIKAPTRSPNQPPAPAQTTQSSRRSGTATIPRRDSNTSGARPERNERDAGSGRDTAKKAKKKKDQTGLYIGIGVGVLVLVAGLYIVLSSGKPKPNAKAKPVDEFVDNDKTPSSEYARRAEESRSKKDSRNAVLLYTKAAERAEKEGNSQKAKEYNMQAITIEKASTLR